MAGKRRLPYLTRLVSAADVAIWKSEGIFIQLLLQHADFLLEIRDDLLLVAVHPASDTD